MPANGNRKNLEGVTLIQGMGHYHPLPEKKGVSGIYEAFPTRGYFSKLRENGKNFANGARTCERERTWNAPPKRESLILRTGYVRVRQRLPFFFSVPRHSP